MKILAYNSSARGAGQFTRSLKIARIITENIPKSKFLILVGNSYLNKQLPNHTDVLKIPEVYKSIEGEYLSLLGDVTETFSIRKAVIESTIKRYDPDLFLVDSKPSGMNDELLDILKRLKLYSKCKIVLMLRDIVDDPILVKANWTKQNVYQLITDIYDCIIIFGNKHTYNAVEKYGITFAEKKIFYLGYIGNKENSLSKYNNQPTEIPRSILVTVGGGFDGDNIVKVVCDYINKTSIINNDYTYKIVIGNNSPLKISNIFENYPNISPNTQIIKHVEDLKPLMYEAELIISMCGYSTVTELISVYKKSILIPRCHSGKEQQIRAGIISQLNDGIWVLPENDLTVERLGVLIDIAMNSLPPTIREKMTAEENLLLFLKKELGYGG